MPTKRVLLVDDEVSFTQIAKLVLEDTGAYEIRVENAARNALKTARHFDPEVIVLDILMPEMSGLDVAASLRSDRQTKACPIIFLSAAMSKEQTSFENELLKDCVVVTKPVSTEDLIAQIEKATTIGSELPVS